MKRARRKDYDLDAMYRQYQSGQGFADVGKPFGLHANTVRRWFISGGLELRGRAQKPMQHFNGRRYTPDAFGYYKSTSAPRTKLHRDVWEFHNGPIPKGWDVHHVDENKANNVIENLQAMPESDHHRLHRLQEWEPHHCLICGKEIDRQKYTSRKAYYARKCCSQRCRAEYLRGKPRGST